MDIIVEKDRRSTVNAAMAHGGVGLTPTFKVIMLGSSSVGKSSII